MGQSLLTRGGQAGFTGAPPPQQQTPPGPVPDPVWTRASPPARHGPSIKAVRRSRRWSLRPTHTHTQTHAPGSLLAAAGIHQRDFTHTHTLWSDTAHCLGQTRVKTPGKEAHLREELTQSLGEVSLVFLGNSRLTKATYLTPVRFRDRPCSVCVLDRRIT